MNFFKLYIGDYQRDTAHLSIAEHGAYVLLLQHYYATEKPLPTGKALHRMLRAQDKAERDAIDTVVAQFWTVTDAGIVNDRADVEITKANAQADTNARIAREREAKRKVEREQHEKSTNRATNDQPNQTPDTRHQTVVTESEVTHTEIYSEQGASACSDPPVQSTTAGESCKAMMQAGVTGCNPSHPTLAALIEAGATVLEFTNAARASIAKGKSNFAYVIGTVKRQREEAAKLVLHKGAMPNKQEALENSNRVVAGKWVPPEMREENREVAA